MVSTPHHDTLSVLWVDDDRELAKGLRDYLHDEGYAVTSALTLAEARAQLRDRTYDLVLVDLSLPDGSGMSLIRDTPRHRAREFVVLTAHSDIKTVLQAMRHQVFDYLIKPLELGELRNTLGRVRKARNSSRPEPEPEPEPEPTGSIASSSPISPVIPPMVAGRSPAMRQVQELLERVAGSEITVLIQGESGTGKEVAARYLHDHSARADGPFVAINCASISPALIASELFGHEKGSFTGAHHQHRGVFERAENGTLLLDEIADMPLDLQATLLRALETGTIMRVGGDREIPVNVRIIAATNRDPLRDVEAGRFRLDLYYRLQVFPISLPPLRDRGADLLALAEHFVAHFSKAGDSPHSLSTDAMSALLQHRWPGNVRELRNVIERACLLSTDRIDATHLLLNSASNLPHFEIPPDTDAEPATTAHPATGTTLRDAEREHIMQMLQTHGGNRTRTAAELGISVKTLYNKLKRYTDSC